MNIKPLLTASILAALASATFAQPVAADSPTARTLTRAQVVAEVQKARALGTLLPPGEVGPATVATQSTLTRAAVVADLAEARAAGELVSVGEVGSFVEQPAGPSRSREEVRQEARNAADQLNRNPLYAGGA